MAVDLQPKDKDVIIVHERIGESLIKDAFSLGGALAAIALGRWLGSSAMQWLGFALFMVVAWAYASHGGSPRKTPQEAADYLRDAYGVMASVSPW